MGPKRRPGIPLAVGLLSAALVTICVASSNDETAQLEYGFHLPRANSYKVITQTFESPMDKSCYSASDCTKKCVESCEMAAVDLKCANGHCRKFCRLSKECNGDVPRHPRGENCRYVCDQGCMLECRESEEISTRDRLRACVEKKSDSCVRECVKVNGKTSHVGCQNVCEVRARSECTAYVTQHCMDTCGRHVCSQDGKCKCPFLLKGNSMCSSYSWLRNVTPKETGYCFQSVFEEKFRTTKFGKTQDSSLVSLVFDHTRNSELALESNRRYVAAKSRELGHDHMATVPSPDLMDMGDFSSCAVVGSAGVLTGKHLGPAIDNHTAVIRFNDAPTSGYEADVGRKTTLRIQNNMYCGFCENPTEILFPYTIGTVENFCYPRMNKPKCKVFKASNELRNFVSRFFEPLIHRFAENSTWYNSLDLPKVDSQASGANRRLMGDKPLVTQMVNGVEVSLKDISAGLTGIQIAMHMCHTVDVYGFGRSDTYYYPKVKRQDRDWSSIHYWPLERKCLEAYDKYMGGVNFIH